MINGLISIWHYHKFGTGKRSDQHQKSSWTQMDRLMDKSGCRITIWIASLEWLTHLNKCPSVMTCHEMSALNYTYQHIAWYSQKGMNLYIYRWNSVTLKCQYLSTIVFWSTTDAEKKNSFIKYRSLNQVSCSLSAYHNRYFYLISITCIIDYSLCKHIIDFIMRQHIAWAYQVTHVGPVNIVSRYIPRWGGLLIHTQTSTVHPLKSGNGQVISSHTL